MKTKQPVMIKGTKEGLTLYLDDACSFSELIQELRAKLSGQYEGQEDRPVVTVYVQTGYRTLRPEQVEEVKSVVREQRHLVVGSIQSDCLTIEEANEWRRQNELMCVTKIVRSGQVLRAPGDLLLVGDVNPGGEIAAGGNIFILGALRGIAHAGCEGNKSAVIAASFMKPSQLRIADYVNRAPDEEGTVDTHAMECAYVDEKDQIVLDRLQELAKLRPALQESFEGGLGTWEKP